MSYQKTNWQDLPSTATPINATNLNKMENGIADANGAIGVDAYDSTATYAVGDLCIYNNTLYECNTTIATSENFTPAHWTATSISEKIKSIEDFNELQTDSYSNASIKNNSINFRKSGRVVSFCTNGDIINLPQGVNTYISSIAEKYRPSEPLSFRVENSASAEYILLRIFPSGLVTLENYRGSAITVATNGDFLGCYVV